MKRYLILFAVVLMVSLLCVPVGASEIVDETAAEAVNVTFFGRLMEYVQENQSEIIDCAIGAAGLILVWTVKSLTGKGNNKLSSALATIKRDTETSVESQGAVVHTINKMVEGYNSMQTAYEKYGATEDDRNRVVGILVAQTTAILEIIVAAYANSKNLPQGVKDLVSLKYANCLKMVDNDEQLLAIVNAVRNNIGAYTGEEQAEEA